MEIFSEMLKTTKMALEENSTKVLNEMSKKRGNFDEIRNFAKIQKHCKKNDESSENRESFENSSKVGHKFKEIAKGVPWKVTNLAKIVQLG